MEQANSRRDVLKAGGVALAAGLAGCTSSDNSGGGTTDTSDTDKTDGSAGSTDNTATPESAFQPTRDTVETIVGVVPGGAFDVTARTWAEAAASYYPGDIRTTIRNRPGADSLIAVQDLYNGPPDGGVIGAWMGATVLEAHSNLTGVSWDDFSWFGSLYPSLRSFSVVHHSRDVSSHFEWTWEDIVASAKEQPLRCASAGAHHTQILELLLRQDPELEEGEHYNIIEFGGGSEVRSAALRGDVDVYPDGFINAYTTGNDEYYKVQAVIADPNLTPDLAEAYSSIESADGEADGVPESAFIVNMDAYPQDAAEDTVRITQDEFVIGAPPRTPQEVVDVHTEAYSAAAQDEELRQNMGEFMHPDNFINYFGNDVNNFLKEKITAAENNAVYQELSSGN